MTKQQMYVKALFLGLRTKKKSKLHAGSCDGKVKWWNMLSIVLLKILKIIKSCSNFVRVKLHNSWINFSTGIFTIFSSSQYELKKKISGCYKGVVSWQCWVKIRNVWDLSVSYKLNNKIINRKLCKPSHVRASNKIMG